MAQLHPEKYYIMDIIKCWYEGTIALAEEGAQIDIRMLIYQLHLIKPNIMALTFQSAQTPGSLVDPVKF